MDPTEVLQHWIEQIESLRPNDFAAVADFARLESRARTESQQWCGRALSDAANPHAKPLAARHAIHVANGVNLDLLRHDYTVRDRPVTVFEGINFVIVQIPGRGPWTREAIEAEVRLMLNASQQWRFQFGESIEDGKVISTNPDVRPGLMPSWTQRADLVVRQGRLYFVVYKRYPQNIGFLHDAQWFEDAVRSVQKR